MKVDLDQVILGFDDKPLKVEGKELKLGEIMVKALATNIEGDNQLPADKMLARWKLAMSAHAGGSQELSPEQITEIRARLPKMFILEVAGRACALLEG